VSSLLSPKYRNAGPHAQIQHLCRIGNRALARADWVESLVDSRSYGYRTEHEIATGRADVERSREKASAAVVEMLAIAKEHGIRPGHLQVVR
jgi:hypothetical protein